MKPATLILVLVAAALVVAPLAGCRSTQRQNQPVAMQPTVPPAPVTYSSPAPTYVSPPVYAAPPLPPVPGSSWASGGEATGYSPDGAFPAAAPPPAAGDLASAIAEEREARVRLDQELGALQDRVRRAQQGASAAPAATGGGAGEEQAARFAQAIRTKSSGEVEQRGSVVVIRFTDAFQPGSEALKQDPRVTAALLATAEQLLQSPGAVVEVVGHSDSTPIKVTKGKWRDNVHLSQERAQTVASALAKQGVPAGRLAVNGRGSVEPLVFPERSDKDRAKNRRVEILVRF